MSRFRLVALALLVGLAPAAYARPAEPAPVAEVVPPAPEAGSSWVPGHWAWQDHDWSWRPGYWQEPAPPVAAPDVAAVVAPPVVSPVVVVHPWHPYRTVWVGPRRTVVVHRW